MYVFKKQLFNHKYTSHFKINDMLPQQHTCCHSVDDSLCDGSSPNIVIIYYSKINFRAVKPLSNCVIFNESILETYWSILQRPGSSLQQNTVSQRHLMNPPARYIESHCMSPAPLQILFFPSNLARAQRDKPSHVLHFES